MISIEQLRCFIAVAEELHFGKAAEKLNMTQPPLSRHIQKLEVSLGFLLLTRSNRQVNLTPAGEAFLEESKRIMNLLTEAPSRAQKIAAGESGRVRIGFTATSALSILTPLLNLTEQTLPEVEIEIHELVSQDQIAKLLVGELDLGLVRDTPNNPALKSQLVHRERVLAAIPSNHPLAASESVTPDDFADQKVVFYAMNGASYFDNLVRRILARVRVHHSLTTTQIHSMLALVSAERGLAIVPESAVKFHFDGVVFRPILGWEEEVVELFAIWSTAELNPVLPRVLDLLMPSSALSR